MPVTDLVDRAANWITAAELAVMVCTAREQMLLEVIRFMVDECTKLVSAVAVATESAHVMLLLLLSLIKVIRCLVLLVSTIVIMRHIHGMVVLRDGVSSH